MTLKKETNRKCPNKILQKSFGSTPMSCSRKVHELRQFIDCKGNVKSCQFTTRKLGYGNIFLAGVRKFQN